MNLYLMMVSYNCKVSKIIVMNKMLYAIFGCKSQYQIKNLSTTNLVPEYVDIVFYQTETKSQ